MVFLVIFGRKEVILVLDLALIGVRRIDYEGVVILDDLKNDTLLVALLDSFNGIVENVRKYCYKIAVAYLNAFQIVGNKGNDDALLFCLKILDVQYRIDQSVAGIDNVNALNLFSELLLNIMDLLVDLAFVGKHEHDIEVVHIVV